MIRINLLKGRPGSNAVLPPALDAAGTPSRFLTKREMTLALAVVAIGGGIIAAQVLGLFRPPPSDDEPLVATYGSPPASRQDRPSADELPVDAPPALEAAPTVPAAPPVVEAPVQPATSAPAPVATPPQPASTAPPEREFGAEPKHTITALKLVPWGEAIEILAQAQGVPQYRSFWLSNPERLVIDVEDAELRVSPAELSRNNPHPLIKQLRAAQNSFEPPLVRIVVETERDGPVDINTTAAGISVKLSPAP